MSLIPSAAASRADRYFNWSDRCTSFFPQFACSQGMRNKFLPQGLPHPSVKNSELRGRINLFSLSESEENRRKRNNCSQTQDILFYRVLMAYSQTDNPSVEGILSVCSLDYVQPLATLILRELLLCKFPAEEGQKYATKLDQMEGRKLVNPMPRNWKGWERLAAELFNHNSFSFDLNPFVGILSPLLNQEKLPRWLNHVIECGTRHHLALQMILERNQQRDNQIFLLYAIDFLPYDTTVSLRRAGIVFHPAIGTHLIGKVLDSCEYFCDTYDWVDSFKEILQFIYQQREGFLTQNERNSIRYWLTYIPPKKLPEVYNELIFFHDFPTFFEDSLHKNKELSIMSEVWHVVKERLTICPEMTLNGIMVPHTQEYLSRCGDSLKRKYGAFFPNYIPLPLPKITGSLAAESIFDVYLVRKDPSILHKFRKKPNQLFSLFIKNNAFNRELTQHQALQGLYIVLETVRGLKPIPEKIDSSFRSLFEASLPYFNQQGIFASFHWFLVMGQIAQAAPRLFEGVVADQTLLQTLYKTAQQACVALPAKTVFAEAVVALAEANIGLFTNPGMFTTLLGPFVQDVDESLKNRTLVLIQKCSAAQMNGISE